MNKGWGSGARTLQVTLKEKSLGGLKRSVMICMSKKIEFI
jgi:hypothetical protein